MWQEFLRYDPADPIWPNRDRFVLSAGHASTLLYSILHLAGVKEVNHHYELTGELAVKLDDLKRFRQLTTGHAVIMGRLTYQEIGKPLPNSQARK